MSKAETFHDKILRGLEEVALVAIERARQTGTKLVVWRNEKIVEVSPDEVMAERAAIPQKSDNP